jgi:hypothetical protein
MASAHRFHANRVTRVARKTMTQHAELDCSLQTAALGHFEQAKAARILPAAGNDLNIQSDIASIPW